MRTKLLLWLLLLLPAWAAQAQVTLMQETFEADGEGTRYTSTTTVNTVSANRYFYRAQNPVSTFGNPANGTVNLGNMQGSYLWACEGVRGTSAASTSTAPPGTLTFSPISNTQTYTNLKVTVAFADPRGNGAGNPNITAADHMRVQYRYGTSGAFTVAGEFTRDPSLANSGDLSLWTRVGGTGDVPALNSTSFSNHTFDIAAGTGALYVQIEADYYGSNKEIAFDNIRVTGIVSSVPKPTIVSNTGTSTLTFAEGTTTPLTVFPSLTLTNPAMTSNPTLTGATVSIATGYAGTEDQLTYGSLPAGITLASNTGQVLTFTGTASTGSYETLLESIQYKDTDPNNATAGDRKLSFTVRSTVDSAPLERIITVTTALNGPTQLQLPYSGENFDTDGEGTRYGSNTRVANSQGFVRLQNASNGSATPGSGFSNGTTTFTNVQGPGYWLTDGTQGIISGGVGRLTLAPINTAGFTNLRFKVRVGSTNGGLTSTEFVRFSYSTDGGNTFTIFANYAGDGTSLRLDGSASNPALTTALINPEFSLPAIPSGATVSFRVETNNGGGELIVFDDIQVTGTQQATVTSITRASANPTNATTVNYTVTFSTAVTGLTASNFTLTTTGTVSGPSVGTPVASTGNTWTVPVNTGTGSGTLTLNLANDAGLSADITTTLPFAGQTYTIDKTAPTAPVVTAPANGSAVATTTPTYTGTAEANSTVTVTVDNSAIGTTTASASGNWTLTQPTALAQGGHTVRATATDAAANTSPSSATNSFTVDTVVPTVSIASSTPGNTNGGTTNTTPVPFTVTFSESVTGFVAGGVSVTGGTLSGFTAVSGSTYTFNVTPTSNGSTVTVNVPANVAQDQAGNFNTAASQYSITYQQPLVASSQAVTVQLDANGNATLTASSVNNNSTGAGTLTYTIQKISFGYIPEGTTPLTLTTPNGANFTQIRFASYGTPNNNTNGNYSLGACNAANSLSAARNAYVGRSSGSLYASNTDTRNNPVLGDPCGGTPKALAVQAGYSADAASLTYDCTEAGKTQYVLLTVTNGTNTSTSVAQVTVNAPPTATISSVSPSAAQRGATVTVAGTNLSGVNSVTVNGATATVSGLSATGFTFVVPTGATIGTGTLTVAAPCSQTLTSTFNVTPALTATVSTTSASPTSTAPIPFSVSFSQSVGTTFAASDVTVTGGTLTSGSFGGSGAGPYTFTVTPSGMGTVSVSLAANVAQDANNTGNSLSNTVSVQFVAPTITVSPSSLPDGTRGTAYSQALSASGGTAPYTYAITAGALPAGLTLSSAGVLAGTPAVSGSFTFTVTSTDNSAAPGPYNGSRSYTLTIAGPTITLVPATLPAGTVAAAYSQALSASGGTAPYTYAITAGALPAGLTLSSAGVLAGTPTAGGAFTFTVTATDASTSASGGPYTGSLSYTLTVAAPTIAVSPPTLLGGTRGTAYSQTITASGGTAPYTYAITAGALPAGLTLSSAGVLAGTPAASGSFNFTVTATDASTGSGPYTGARSYTLSIAGLTIAVSPATLLGGTVAAAYSQALSASGGTAPYTYAITAGALPAGLSLSSSGTIAGTPTAGGTFNFTVTATDASTSASGGPYSGARSYTLTIAAPTITVAPASLPGGTQNTAYSQALSASGGTAPYTFAITAGALPAGLSLSSSGTIAGTPTTNGTFNFTVTATDASTGSGPYTGSRSYSLTIAAPAVTLVTWTGNTTTDWFTASNWTPNQVPDATIDAVIPTSPSGGRFPVIVANASQANARNVSIAAAATLTMTGNTLTLAANLTNNGTFRATGGTVDLGSTAVSNILGASNTRFWNLTVGANGARQSTSASTSVQQLLTLNGSYTTNGNPFTLESNANSTAMVINNGSSVVNGNVTVQRYIDPRLNPNLGYRHVSTAVSGQTVSNLATGSFAPVVNPAYNASAQPGTITPFPTVYGYDQSRLATATNNLATFDKGWVSPNALSDALNVGQGYTALISGGQTWAFTGALNNGTQTLTLARNTGATANDAGLSLVGNPYPSPLDWRQVVSNGLSNVDGALYVFQSNDPTNPYTGSYGVYANNLGNISPILPQGQGFFVRVTQGQTSGTLTFANSQRPTTYTATTYYRTAAETRPLVQLSLKAAGSAKGDDAFVYFEQGSTEGFDSQYDARKLPNPSGLNLSTTVGSEQFSIDGRPAIGTVQRVIPLAVGVPAAGAYSLSSAQLLNLATTPVYLRDKQTGALIDLAQQPTYQFTVSNASALITSRFELVFSPQQALATVPAALAQQVALYPNPAKKAAFVELPASLGRQAVTASLVDALGRVVRTVSLPAKGALAHQLDLSELATGVYALRLSTSAGVVVKKLVIE